MRDTFVFNKFYFSVREKACLFLSPNIPSILLPFSCPVTDVINSIKRQIIKKESVLQFQFSYIKKKVTKTF